MKIIFINGKKRAGKDTFVDYFKSGAAFYKLSVCAISSIDPVRNALASMDIDVDDKTPELRAAMSEIGDVLQKRFQYRSKWVCEQALDADMDDTRALFVHMREPVIIQETIDLLAQHGFDDVAKVFIQSNRGDSQADSNVSDAGVWQDNFYDFVYSNNGTIQELSHGANELLKKLFPARTKVLP